ncbi:MAG: hypothetical protein IPN06_20675 [Burkholderiales bacterium]|nr:hypothetical protein [Burkholderiales bacterium]
MVGIALVAAVLNQVPVARLRMAENLLRYVCLFHTGKGDTAPQRLDFPTAPVVFL